MSVTFYAVAPAGCLPCCNGNANAISVSCRQRGGTAGLCGYAEFTSPSSPPQFYRRKDFSDTGFYRCVYGSTGCVTEAGSDTSSYSGFTLYDAVTCNIDSTALIHSVWTHNGTLVCQYPNQNTGADHADPGCWTENVRYTSTRNQTTCTRSGAGCTGSESFFGSQSQALSVPDTETDAITRLLAVSNYSAWTQVGDGSGSTCVPAACCKSNYQARTSNAFTYTESQYRANVQAANATSYSLIAELWRAPSGFSNYVLYSYKIDTFTTNATGFASTVVNIPITRGYQTYAANVEYF